MIPQNVKGYELFINMSIYIKNFSTKIKYNNKMCVVSACDLDHITKSTLNLTQPYKIGS